MKNATSTFLFVLSTREIYHNLDNKTKLMKKIIIAILFYTLLSTLYTLKVHASELFPDLHDSDPATTSIEYLYENDVIEGYADGTFGPFNLINRAEFMKMIVEGVAGITPDEDEYKNCFPDVWDDWYAKYVCYAAEQEWVAGYGDTGYFEPADNISKAEAIKILVEAFDWETTETYWYSDFYDVYSDQWYYDYILAAEEKGIFDKMDSYLTPGELLNRREFSILLERAMKYEADEEFTVWEIENTSATYEEVLATGIEAAFPSDLEINVNSQYGWDYGCYAFSVKNLIEWKYAEVLDMSEIQETIDWDGEFIWDHVEMQSFSENYQYDLIMTYYSSPEFFLKTLATGEPIVLYIPYYIGEDNIGHQVMAYSFDENGVWIADSLSGGTQRQIGWDEVFVDDANYTTNMTKLRKVKSGGEFKMQW